MFFFGRSFDTFESAIAMLIGKDVYYDHIDCISGRAFAISRKDDKTLFSCVLSIEDAVKNINNNLGDILSVVSPCGLHEPFVIELQQDIGIPTIFRKYYQYGHYVFCHRRDNKIYINDPDGFPDLSFPVEELRFGEQKAVILTGAKSLLKLDISAALETGKNFICAARDSDLTTASLSRLFIQYAIRNYVCQTNKVLVFLCSHVSVPKTTCSLINSLFEQMLSLSKYSYNEINLIDGQISSLLEELL